MASSGQTFARRDEAVRIAPASMPLTRTVDERFQSYNVEMVEVTGGRFWAPFSPRTFAALENPQAAIAAATPEELAATPAGMNPALYEQRPPIDLSNERLRKLASALAPAYMRVSGTWANTTWFADSEDAPKTSPEGYGAILTQDMWRGVIDFSKAVDARIVTSVPISPGSRDANGVWTPDQSRRWFGFTRENGGEIAAAEYFNEPNMAVMGGAPEGYDAKDFGRDFNIFRKFIEQDSPDTLLLGPGSVGETTQEQMVDYGVGGILATPDMLTAMGEGNQALDAFTYHHYGAVSIRCGGTGAQTAAEAALSEDWLARVDGTNEYYRQQRDQFSPGTPLWNTETAETACGGNPWAKTFLDSFRYVDQLGRSAMAGVTVHMHNTLAASDYALLDEHTFAPRPSYWAALLWRNLMGTRVLDSGIPVAQGMHVYAHCLRGVPGGVALLAINNDPAAPRSLTLPVAGRRYTLSAPDLQADTVLLNGRPLALGEGDTLPDLAGSTFAAGEVTLAPATITFLALPEAGNPACS